MEESLRRSSSDPISILKYNNGLILNNEDIDFLKKKYKDNPNILQFIRIILNCDFSFHFYFDEYYMEEAIKYCLKFINDNDNNNNHDHDNHDNPIINMKPLKITLVGPPYVGKSRFAKWLKQHIGIKYVLVDVDDVINTLKSSGRVKLEFEGYTILRRFSGLIAEVLENYYLQNGLTIVTPKTISDLEWYKSTIKYPELIILLDSEDKILLKNKKSRDDSGTQDILSIETFERLTKSSRRAMESLIIFTHPLIEVLSIFIDTSYNYLLC
jgi:hypothetical protein